MESVTMPEWTHDEIQLVMDFILEDSMVFLMDRSDYEAQQLFRNQLPGGFGVCGSFKNKRKREGPHSWQENLFCRRALEIMAEHRGRSLGTYTLTASTLITHIANCLGWDGCHTQEYLQENFPGQFNFLDTPEPDPRTPAQ